MILQRTTTVTFARKRTTGMLLMLCQSLAVACGTPGLTGLPDARENRLDAHAEPTHQIRVVLDKNDQPTKIQVVRVRRGRSELLPAEPRNAKRLDAVTQRQAELLRTLQAGQSQLQVVLYSKEDVGSVASATVLSAVESGARALESNQSALQWDPPVYFPEDDHWPLTPDQSASAFDIEAAKIEALVNQYLLDNPEPDDLPSEAPALLAAQDSDCSAQGATSQLSALGGPTPCADLSSKKMGVKLGRIAMVAVGVTALCTLAAPFAAATVTMFAVKVAATAAITEVTAAGTALTILSNDMHKCLRGETV